MIDCPRSQWVRAFTAIPEPRLKDVAATLKKHYTVQPLMIPEAGLGLLKLQDGALHDHFYLGEFPVASAHLKLVDETGNAYEGGCHVMHDAADYAVDLAICDAVLAHRLTGFEAVSELLNEGIEARREEEKVREAMRQTTRVDFSLLSNVDEEKE